MWCTHLLFWFTNTCLLLVLRLRNLKSLFIHELRKRLKIIWRFNFFIKKRVVLPIWRKMEHEEWITRNNLLLQWSRKDTWARIMFDPCLCSAANRFLSFIASHAKILPFSNPTHFFPQGMAPVHYKLVCRDSPFLKMHSLSRSLIAISWVTIDWWQDRPPHLLHQSDLKSAFIDRCHVWKACSIVLAHYYFLLASRKSWFLNIRV